MIYRSWKSYDILNNMTVNLDKFDGIYLDQIMEQCRQYHLSQGYLNLNLNFHVIKFTSKL